MQGNHAFQFICQVCPPLRLTTSKSVVFQVMSMRQVIDTRHFITAEQQIAFHNILRAGDSLHLGIVLVENHLLVTGDANLAQLAQALGLATVHIP